MKIFVFVSLALFASIAHADSPAAPSPVSKQFENLGVQQTQIFQFTPQEADAVKRQAIEGFQANLEKSDPETQTAIRRAIRDLKRKEQLRAGPARSTQSRTSHSK